MRDIKKYQGVIPAFYACYDSRGEISPEMVRELTYYFCDAGVKGVYVGGSSGECIYQSVEERKLVLENVMAAAGGKLTVIAHVGCNNTRDSMELARHAKELGVDAIASIPPIYFHLPDYSIADYWNAISAAAPDTDFIIYNIPQLAGVSLTLPLLEIMLENPSVIGVKNSSTPVQDIWMFRNAGSRSGRPFIVFNGPDEQLFGGLAMGAQGCIGGTYGAMPRLILRLWELAELCELEKARQLQYEIDDIIYCMCSCHGNMYAVIKEILRRRSGIDLGGVREPLTNLIPEDMEKVSECEEMIVRAEAKWLV